MPAIPRAPILSMRLSMRRAWILLAAIALASPRGARGDCVGPLCGSFVEAEAFQPVIQKIDATDGMLADQSLGPARATWLGDPANPATPGSTSDTSARLTLAIDHGVLAVESGSANQSNLGMIVQGVGISRAEYEEVLSVDSSTLAAGTPVTLRMRAVAVFAGAAQHDLPEIGSGSFNYARMDFTLNATLGGNPLQHFWHEGAGEKPFRSGVFAYEGRPLEVTAHAQVGQLVHLDFALIANSASSAIPVSPPPPNPLELPAAATGGTAAIAFGIESDTPGVEIDSALLGGPVPGFVAATAANALGYVIPVDVGIPVTVPEPGWKAQAASALATLIGVARGRR